jgi:hypothetical protein
MMRLWAALPLFFSFHPSPGVVKWGVQQDKTRPDILSLSPAQIDTPSKNFFQKSNFLRKDDGGNESMEVFGFFDFDEFTYL